MQRVHCFAHVYGGMYLLQDKIWFYLSEAAPIPSGKDLYFHFPYSNSALLSHKNLLRRTAAEPGTNFPCGEAITGMEFRRLFTHNDKWLFADG